MSPLAQPLLQVQSDSAVLPARTAVSADGGAPGAVATPRVAAAGSPAGLSIGSVLKKSLRPLAPIATPGRSPQHPLAPPAPAEVVPAAVAAAAGAMRGKGGAIMRAPADSVSDDDGDDGSEGDTSEAEHESRSDGVKWVAAAAVVAVALMGGIALAWRRR